MARKRIIVYRAIEDSPKSDPSLLCVNSECEELKSKDDFCEYHHPSRYCTFKGCHEQKSWWAPDGGLCKEHETESFYMYKHPGIYPQHLRFVYLMYSNRLSALKIGIGQFGRIEQIKQSEYVDPISHKREKALWYVLKIGRFSTTNEPSAVTLPKFLAAEKQVLNYWREELGIGPHLTADSLVYVAKSDYLLRGSSETVKLGSVCEIETWKRIQGADGYLGDTYFRLGLDMTPRSKRSLKCWQSDHEH